jgi:hypothetical protein
MELPPKKKAEELITLMLSPVDEWHKYPMCRDTAKQCAIIAVEQLITETKSKYWYEVKHELTNL